MPLVQSATLDDLFANVSNEQALGTNVQRRLAPTPPPAAPVTPPSTCTTASELAAFRAVVGARDPVVVNGEAALLTTLSTSMTPERVTQELAQIDVAVRSFTAGVIADEKRITLTSRRGRGAADVREQPEPARAVTVRVHLESPKLLFPKGADQIRSRSSPGATRSASTSRPGASGTFPMTITVTSPDGQLSSARPCRSPCVPRSSAAGRSA